MDFVVEPCDLAILQNDRIKTLSKNDWGKTTAIINEHIHIALLRDIFRVDEVQLENKNKGYDILLKGSIRIQSKLRQVAGKTKYSKSLHFETTRRHTKNNANLYKNGHVCYSNDEFDYVVVSVIHLPIDRSDVNQWMFCIAPVHELCETKSCHLKSSIEPALLSKYEINKNQILLGSSNRKNNVKYKYNAKTTTT